MNEINTVRELFAHYDWANDMVLAASLPLADEQLDRVFEMGWGTLRKTLWHIHSSEHIWLQRASGQALAPLAPPGDRPPMSTLQTRAAETRARRYQLLESIQEDASIERSVIYSDARGNRHQSRLDDILLHVCNHGTHHRAQAAHMLQQLGVNPPKLDYLYLKLELQAAPRLSKRLVRDYHAYNDWANRRLTDCLRKLDPSHLDRAFEIGKGSIRKTLLHMYETEQRWLNGWRQRETLKYQSTLDDTATLEEIQSRCDQTAQERNQFLSDAPDDAMERKIKIDFPAGPRDVPIAVTMLQLGSHGTHHRAHLINMLRHCGQSPPPSDYIVMKREENPPKP